MQLVVETTCIKLVDKKFSHSTCIKPVDKRTHPDIGLIPASVSVAHTLSGQIVSFFHVYIS